MPNAHLVNVPIILKVAAPYGDFTRQSKSEMKTAT